MTSSEIRQSFLDFFASKEHRIVESAPVVPHGDPTLLFTNAGMNQFKDVFLGTGTRDYLRAADTQKCIRVSGKHNDLEEVGVDTYHHTLFEMLGNWSFGDYYKEEAIQWAWELLTKVWNLDIDRLHATVFRTDDEAYQIWCKYLPKERIHRFDEKDNFWEMGDSGPCGPCSEIHYDNTPDLSGAKLVNAGVPEVIEIWNLVFIQYNRKPDGQLEELKAKHVDTGMGFERICAVIQKVDSNYDTDIFMPVISKIEELSNKKYTKQLDNPNSIAMRVIADHLRTLSFAIADGALPGNEGRSYVLRRILRRASRYARNLGFKEPVIYLLLPTLIDLMGKQFPELIGNKELIEKVIKAEEESFLQTLDRGLEIFDDISEHLSAAGETEIPGADVFLLYDTFGFPPDLTELIARERGFTINKHDFNIKMNEQKERSRQARKKVSQDIELPSIDAKSEFVGYSDMSAESTIIFAEDNMVVLEKTPFYVESGGQVSDTGELVFAGEKYEVIDVKKSGDAIFHILDRAAEPLVGAKGLAKIDAERRKNIMRNHSATHLMHQALNEVLGDHIKQAGSLVAPDYLRFDFNHYEKLKKEEIKRIEKIVNDKILENIDVITSEKELEEARKNSKIKMFFGDKYGDKVRVVAMDEKYSIELCGGTHVKNTAEIGMFKIISESSIAAGVRRIEAITGRAVVNYLDDLDQLIFTNKAANEDLINKIKFLEKEISFLKTNALAESFEEWLENATKFNGINIIAKVVAAESLDQLRDMGEMLRERLGTGIGLLATINDGKVQLVCVATNDIKSKYPAGKLVGEVAKSLGGGGGGKPHLATAGGKNIEKIDEVINGFADLIKNF